MKRLTLMGIGLGASICQVVVAVIWWREIWAVLNAFPVWAVWLTLFIMLERSTKTAVRILNLKTQPAKGD